MPNPAAAMSALDQLREVAFLVAPGFLTLKVFQLFGSERKRSEWEWAVWSVLVSLVIDVLTQDPARKFFVAASFGAILVLLYRLPLPLNDRIRRELSNSAWDYTLDRASKRRDRIELTVGDTKYFGVLKTFAREESAVEPWVFLRDVSERPPGGDWRKLSRTEGILVHADNIELLRMIRKTTPQPPATTDGGAESTNGGSP